MGIPPSPGRASRPLGRPVVLGKLRPKHTEPRAEASFLEAPGPSRPPRRAAKANPHHPSPTEAVVTVPSPGAAVSTR